MCSPPPRQNGRAAPSREQLVRPCHGQRPDRGAERHLDNGDRRGGRLQVDAAPFDPVRLIRELGVLTRPQRGARAWNSAFMSDPELESRRAARPSQTWPRAQVVANLLGNAVKYTVRGRVEARVERLGENRLAISIADTGPGLSPEEMIIAFEPSSGVPVRVRACRRGLGLSLSRQLVALMEAELTPSPPWASAAASP